MHHRFIDWIISTGFSCIGICSLAHFPPPKILVHFPCSFPRFYRPLCCSSILRITIPIAMPSAHLAACLSCQPVLVQVLGSFGFWACVCFGFLGTLGFLGHHHHANIGQTQTLRAKTIAKTTAPFKKPVDSKKDPGPVKVKLSVLPRWNLRVDGFFWGPGLVWVR